MGWDFVKLYLGFSFCFSATVLVLTFITITLLRHVSFLTYLNLLGTKRLCYSFWMLILTYRLQIICRILLHFDWIFFLVCTQFRVDNQETSLSASQIPYGGFSESKASFVSPKQSAISVSEAKRHTSLFFALCTKVCILK